MTDQNVLRERRGVPWAIRRMADAQFARAAVALMVCGAVAFFCGARFNDEEVDHDIVLKNHKLLIKDDDGQERVRVAINKIVLKDSKGVPRIQIAIEEEENGRAGIHFYSKQGLRRMFVGCDRADVPVIIFFDSETGRLPHRRIGPDGPNL